MRVTRLEEPKPEDPGFLTSFIYNPIVSYLSVSRGAAGSLDASNEDDEDGADGDEDEDEEHDDETGEVVVGPRTAFTPKSKIHVHTSLAAYKAYALGRARSAGKPRGPDYVVLTAKRTGTAAAIEEMKACGLGAAVSGSGDDAAAASPAGSAEDARFWERTAVVTFQNGARAGEEIRRAFSERVEVVEGMWPFNVVEPEPCHYFQATSGTLYVTDSPTGRAFHKLLIAGSLPAKTSKDMDGVLYGKLLFNLNNAVCALADSTIRSTLVVRGYRKAYAMCVTEALAVYTAAGIHPVSFVPVPLWVLPYILSLPTPLFSRVAASFLAIDPAAVSSTTVDLRDGKPTEIAYLQGEICRLAREHYVAAPMCDRIVGLVREAESLGKGNWERIGPEELLDALEML
ncbi:ketopantoate reductase PanE/ApbA C terminal-domain-containing protein [Zopfochytrium polystomum]|nr:ketopantoate reductase PanE/ApbA C terminal-domain-containing protein [Zopfochytrium polystomum]